MAMGHRYRPPPSLPRHCASLSLGCLFPVGVGKKGAGVLPPDPHPIASVRRTLFFSFLLMLPFSIHSVTREDGWRRGARWPSTTMTAAAPIVLVWAEVGMRRRRVVVGMAVVWRQSRGTVSLHGSMVEGQPRAGRTAEAMMTYQPVRLPTHVGRGGGVHVAVWRMDVTTRSRRRISWMVRWALVFPRHR